MGKCTVAIGSSVRPAAKSRFGNGAIIAIFSAAAAAAAALWLARIVRWIGEPDYITPHSRVERKIDGWIERILQ